MPSSSARKADSTSVPALELKLAHSPDSDDAFMFYALATKRVRTRKLKFTHVLEDIETLNQKARDEVYDITAMSFHAYAHFAGRYALLPCGASFGDRYGPIIVAKNPLAPAALKKKRVAVPGKLTTAYLVLQLYEPDVEAVFTPFDRILESVARGDVDAGVVIHEGQLTFARQGLRKIVDLGEWWYGETQLPLPLGGNAVRKSLDPAVLNKLSKLLKESIRYSLDHREEALEYALQFARGVDSSTADQFVSMYVNEWTLDYGERGRKAVQTLLDRGFERGILPQHIQAEFIE